MSNFDVKSFNIHEFIEWKIMPLFFRCPLFIGGEGLMKSKACLSEESQSDHMTLLRAFQGWQESGNAGDFCTGYNLSQVMLF